MVHNGIIENHRTLRARLLASGHRLTSDTDTEVLAHLIEQRITGSLEAAVAGALSEIHGACAVAVVDQEFPDRLVAARVGGSPLIVGIADGEYVLASDIPALLPLTRDILVLEDGELATLTRGGVTIRRLDGAPVQRAVQQVTWSAEAAEKAGYPHFMLKEIAEQPTAVAATLQGRIDPDTGLVDLGGPGPHPGGAPAGAAHRPGRLRHLLARRPRREVPPGGVDGSPLRGGHRLGVPLPAPPGQ